MRLEDQLERLELIDLVSDCIDMDIPYICILDTKDREVILFLPESNESSEFNMEASEKVVNSFFCIEDYDETDSIDNYLINPNDN